MALFGRKKPAPEGDPAAVQSEETAAGTEFQPQPENALKWFEHARTAADSSNFAYALNCYAHGIKLDPEVMSAHEAMYEAAVKYANSGGKPARGKEVRTIEDSHPVTKFAAAEFAWMKDVTNGNLALKALAAAVKANQLEFGHWAAPRVLGAIRRSKKPSKSTLIQAKEIFKEIGALDEALVAGQLAYQLDPTDSALDHELKDLAAQRAMDQGGYEEAAGKEGGYRHFVKDAEKHRELQESEAIVAGQSTEERLLQRARLAYEQTPTVPDVINQYAQVVKKQGTPEAARLAYDIYMKGFQDTGEYRFRMYAGDIQIEQLQNQLESVDELRQASPNDRDLESKSERIRQKLHELEAAEYSERVAKYPTDRHMKLRLGEVEYARGRYEDAMAAFQAAKDEPKLRVRAGHMLGRSFAAECWHREAISEFKDALAAIDATEKERELAIRYDLMLSLIEQARMEKSAAEAREALEICSTIARKNITYRDIRAKRKEVDHLLRELTGSETAS